MASSYPIALATWLGRTFPDEQADPERNLIQREQDHILQRALQHLPEREVLMLQLRFEHTLSIKEIAGIMRLDELEVRNSLVASLQKLKTNIER